MFLYFEQTKKKTNGMCARYVSRITLKDGTNYTSFLYFQIQGMFWNNPLMYIYYTKRIFRGDRSVVF